MATGLQAFTNHDFGTIRTITSSGQVLFCGRDVATALGYRDPINAVKLHCKWVANYHPLQTSGCVQQVRFISEGDLYRLIVSSNLPAAQQFEAWMFDDVLPSIRSHGVYAIDELLADDEFWSGRSPCSGLNVPSGSPPNRHCWRRHRRCRTTTSCWHRHRS